MWINTWTTSLCWWGSHHFQKMIAEIHTVDFCGTVCGPFKSHNIIPAETDTAPHYWTPTISLSWMENERLSFACEAPSSRPECDPERTRRGCEPWGTESHQIAQFPFFTRDPHPEISHGWSVMRSCRCVPSSPLCFCQFICLSWILSSSLSALSCRTSSASRNFKSCLCYCDDSVFAQLYVSEETCRNDTSCNL